MPDAPESRRLSAILAADVVGWTARLAEDEAGTLAALRALRAEVFDPAVAEQGGRVVKLMGDGALVEFPSVVAAVSAAARVQRELAARRAPLALRIGVALGDVVVDGEDLYGDGVNLAARLEAEAEPGGVLLSRAAAEQARGKAGLALDPLGPRVLKGLPEPEEVFQVRLDAAAPPPAATPAARRGPSLRLLLVAAALLALLASAAAVWQTLGPADDAAVAALPDKPSIAVLPFENLSGDPAQDWFADGLAEDLITDLAQLPELFVIARNSAFAYKGRAEDSRAVGRALGVAYLLEGSVRRSGDAVRVNAKLIDASDGESLWADRIEGEITDVFALQDRIVAEIAENLSRELGVVIETPAGGATGSVDGAALEHYWKGHEALAHMDWVNAGVIGSDVLVHLEKAVALTPDNPRFLASLGWYHMHSLPQGYVGYPNATASRAPELAERSLAIADTPLARMLAAAAMFELEKRDAEAIAMGMQAMNDAPSEILILQNLGSMLLRAGKLDDAVAVLSELRRVDPFGPDGRPGFGLGLALLLKGRHVEAEAILRERAAVRSEHRPIDRLYLIAALTGTGQIEEAREIALDYVDYCEPDYSTSITRGNHVGAWCNLLALRNQLIYAFGFRQPEQLEPLFEGLRAAGFPEEPA